MVGSVVGSAIGSADLLVHYGEDRVSFGSFVYIC